MNAQGVEHQLAALFPADAPPSSVGQPSAFSPDKTGAALGAATPQGPMPTLTGLTMEERLASVVDLRQVRSLALSYSGQPTSFKPLC